MRASNKIILIDDDPMFNFIHSEIIKTANQNYVVQSFGKVVNAFAELEKIAQTDPDNFGCTIFLDINMPVLNGWDFLERLTQLPEALVNSCKIFMLSSSNDITDIRKSKTYPIVSGFISKPLTVKQLIDISEKEYSAVKFLIAG